ncbi:FMN-dependent NADH-azoreductase [Trueperella bialowiezensis]|uniref:FMN dependent NADH:quinone oxidoreductase n=2 Tax=Trueperella bialowiezensis TaxID=312285 RepID=A0A3S4V6A5_9ACTO|nr:FMN-dependent NADH-azoreductase [Trueperella bialowiezensis]
MQMTDAFVAAFKEAHPEAQVQELRLYEVAIPEIDLDLLTGWSALGSGEHFAHLTNAQQNKITLFNTYTQQFLDADVVVIANPLWNLSIPTRLKAWVDTVVVSGTTFRYNEQGEAEGLARGKRVIHLQASGGHFNAQDPACRYIKGVFSFIGCEVDQIVAEGMDHEPDRADDIMAGVFDKIRELARSI